MFVLMAIATCTGKHMKEVVNTIKDFQLTLPTLSNIVCDNDFGFYRFVDFKAANGSAKELIEKLEDKIVDLV
jgi:hypothetical protein